MLQRSAAPRPLAALAALTLLLGLVSATSPGPAAAQPEPGTPPDLVEIRTRRDAGSQFVPGLGTLVSETSTPTASPLVPLDETSTVLPESSTALPEGGAAVEIVEVETGTARLVAAVTASDGDVVLTVTGDGDAEQQVCPCDLLAPPPGSYRVRAENTGSTPAEVTFGTAVVPADPDGAPNLFLDASDERLTYDEPALDPGETWYAAVSSGDETVPVNLDRLTDDVTKTASVASADAGDTITYTLGVQPNVTPEDLTYTITDSIPDGLTYVEGSATNGVIVEDDTVSWEVDAAAGDGTQAYAVTTSDDDLACRMPGGGRYLEYDFETYGQPTISGDDAAWVFPNAPDAAPFEFYGAQYDAVTVTADGYLVMGDGESLGPPGLAAPQPLLDPAVPNAVVAPLWDDWEIVYDAEQERGVSAVLLGSTGPEGSFLIDYGGVQRAGAEPGQPTYDFQVLVYRTPSSAPGNYEIYYAYRNLGPLESPVTVGVEDAVGERGTTVLNLETPGDEVRDGGVVCLDDRATTATYQVMVDPDVDSGPVTNVASHTVDQPGSRVDEATAVVDLVADTMPPTVNLDAVPTVSCSNQEPEGPCTVRPDARIRGTSSEPGTVAVTVTGPGTSLARPAIPVTDGGFRTDVGLGGRPDGSYRATVRATDPAGNVGAPVFRTFVKDTVATRPTIARLAPVTRANQTRYQVSGTAEPRSAVSIAVTDRSGEQVLGSVTADAAGRFTVRPPFNLAGLRDGSIRVQAVARDVHGNLSELSEVARTTKSTTLPPTPPDPDPPTTQPEPPPAPEPEPEPPSPAAPEPEPPAPAPQPPAPAPEPTATPPPSRPPAPAPVPAPAPEPAPPPTPMPPQTVQRAAGGGRVQTSIEVSRAAYDTAQTVLLARADAYPDALAGSTLATAEGAPLLLNPSDTLDPDVAAEIARLGASRVVLLGGETAQGPGVVFELVTRGLVVERIGGASRFETAGLVADRVATLVPVDEFVVVEGGNAEPSRGWPDALSASGLAASEGMPILLATAESVPPETAARLRPDADVLVVGGVNAVGEGAAAALDEAAGTVTRLAGPTRYGTSAAVADEAVARGLDLSTVWVATGLNFPDALSAGAAAGAVGTTLLLVDGQGLDASVESRDFLTAHATTIDTVRVAGGEQVVTPAVATALQAAIAAR